ncbi:unnamed protein product, partial [marine sediment metagenome]
MKTGFIQAFVNLMKPVSYPYHGIISPCHKQSEIPPYMGPDMKPVGQEWVLAFEGSIYAGAMGIFIFKPKGFLPSSDPHMCTDKTHCNKNVYYFTEVYVYQRAYNEMVGLYWSDGINCDYRNIAGKYLYIYKAWFDYQWCANNHLWMV